MYAFVLSYQASSTTEPLPGRWSNEATSTRSLRYLTRISCVSRSTPVAMTAGDDVESGDCEVGAEPSPAHAPLVREMTSREAMLNLIPLCEWCKDRA